MSHYTVAVFTKSANDSIDDLLAPYFEELMVEPYVSQTKAQIIQCERDRMQNAFNGPYAEWQRDPFRYEKASNNPQHIEYLKTLPALMRQSDEQIYRAAIREYEADVISEDGGILSTRNPQSKWDWYEVGGRWSGMLILKEAAAERLRKAGLMTDSGNCDHAFTADIDFDAVIRRYRSKLRPYEEFIAQNIYAPEYMRERYPTEAEYLARQSLFQTYAVITPDGAWHAPGVMGWFGITSEAPAQEREWQLAYHERFIKPAIENGWYITIVDCHI